MLDGDRRLPPAPHFRHQVRSEKGLVLYFVKLDIPLEAYKISFNLECMNKEI